MKKVFKPGWYSINTQISNRTVYVYHHSDMGRIPQVRSHSPYYTCTRWHDDIPPHNPEQWQNSQEDKS